MRKILASLLIILTAASVFGATDAGNQKSTLGVDNYVAFTIAQTWASPADGATAYLTISGAAPSATDSATNATRSIAPGGTVTKLCIQYAVTGTLGSSENVTATVRKTGVDQSMTFTMQFTSASSTTTCVTTNTFAVAEGDHVSVKLVAPTW